MKYNFSNIDSLFKQIVRFSSKIINFGGVANNKVRIELCIINIGVL
jgi:hypothetical protein